MYIFFEKLLNQKQCDELNQAALRMMMENRLSHEVDNSRDDLQCEKHQMVIQSFYHWRFTNAS